MLDHDTHGTHLNSSGKTVNLELEKKNFAAAGNVLAERWSSMTIDDEKVYAEYQNPDRELDPAKNISYKFHIRHVRMSCYGTQIVRCTDLQCCGPWRSAYKKILPERYLPAPVPFVHDESGPMFAESESIGRFLGLAQRLMLRNFCPSTSWRELPFDYYYPSITNIDELVCAKCHIYFPSTAWKNRHARTCRSEAAADADENEIDEEEIDAIPDCSEMCDNENIFLNIKDFVLGELEIIVD